MSSEKISQQIKKYGKPISGELEQFLNKFFPNHVNIHSQTIKKISPLRLAIQQQNQKLIEEILNLEPIEKFLDEKFELDMPLLNSKSFAWLIQAIVTDVKDTKRVNETLNKLTLEILKRIETGLNEKQNPDELCQKFSALVSLYGKQMEVSGSMDMMKSIAEKMASLMGQYPKLIKDGKTYLSYMFQKLFKEKDQEPTKKIFDAILVAASQSAILLFQSVAENKKLSLIGYSRKEEGAEDKAEKIKEFNKNKPLITELIHGIFKFNEAQYYKQIGELLNGSNAIEACLYAEDKDFNQLLFEYGLTLSGNKLESMLTTGFYGKAALETDELKTFIQFNPRVNSRRISSYIVDALMGEIMTATRPAPTSALPYSSVDDENQPLDNKTDSDISAGTSAVKEPTNPEAVLKLLKLPLVLQNDDIASLDRWFAMLTERKMSTEDYSQPTVRDISDDPDLNFSSSYTPKDTRDTEKEKKDDEKRAKWQKVYDYFRARYTTDISSQLELAMLDFEARAEKIPMDDTLFAHIHNDHALMGTTLQGSQLVKTMGYLKEYIDEKLLDNTQSKEKVEDWKRLSKNLGSGLSIAHMISQFVQNHDKIQATEESIIHFISAKIWEKLNFETELLIPGGWVGLKGTVGHAMLYEIKKGPNGKYQFIIHNTGSGIENHPQRELQNMRQFSSVKVYELPSGSLKDNEAAIKSLLYTIVKPRITPAYGKEGFTADKLYKQIKDVAIQYGFRELPSPNTQEWTRGQYSGTCAWQVVGSSYLKTFPFGSGIKPLEVIFDIEQSSLLKYYKTQKALGRLRVATVERQLNFALQSFALFINQQRHRVPPLNEDKANKAFKLIQEISKGMADADVSLEVTLKTQEKEKEKRKEKEGPKSKEEPTTEKEGKGKLDQDKETQSKEKLDKDKQDKEKQDKENLGKEKQDKSKETKKDLEMLSEVLIHPVPSIQTTSVGDLESREGTVPPPNYELIAFSSKDPAGSLEKLLKACQENTQNGYPELARRCIEQFYLHSPLGPDAFQAIKDNKELLGTCMKKIQQLNTLYVKNCIKESLAPIPSQGVILMNGYAMSMAVASLYFKDNPNGKNDLLVNELNVLQKNCAKIKNSSYYLACDALVHKRMAEIEVFIENANQNLMIPVAEPIANPRYRNIILSNAHNQKMLLEGVEKNKRDYVFVGIQSAPEADKAIYYYIEQGKPYRFYETPSKERTAAIKNINQDLSCALQCERMGLELELFLGGKTDGFYDIKPETDVLETLKNNCFYHLYVDSNTQIWNFILDSNLDRACQSRQEHFFPETQPAIDKDLYKNSIATRPKDSNIIQMDLGDGGVLTKEQAFKRTLLNIRLNPNAQVVTMIDLLKKGFDHCNDPDFQTFAFLNLFQGDLLEKQLLRNPETVLALTSLIERGLATHFKKERIKLPLFFFLKLEFALHHLLVSLPGQYKDQPAFREAEKKLHEFESKITEMIQYYEKQPKDSYTISILRQLHNLNLIRLGRVSQSQLGKVDPQEIDEILKSTFYIRNHAQAQFNDPCIEHFASKAATQTGLLVQNHFNALKKSKDNADALSQTLNNLAIKVGFELPKTPSKWQGDFPEYQLISENKEVLSLNLENGQIFKQGSRILPLPTAIRQNPLLIEFFGDKPLVGSLGPNNSYYEFEEAGFKYRFVPEAKDPDNNPRGVIQREMIIDGVRAWYEYQAPLSTKNFQNKPLSELETGFRNYLVKEYGESSETQEKFHRWLWKERLSKYQLEGLPLNYREKDHYKTWVNIEKKDYVQFSIIMDETLKKPVISIDSLTKKAYQLDAKGKKTTLCLASTDKLDTLVLRYPFNYFMNFDGRQFSELWIDEKSQEPVALSFPRYGLNFTAEKTQTGQIEWVWKEDPRYKIKLEGSGSPLPVNTEILLTPRKIQAFGKNEKEKKNNEKILLDMGEMLEDLVLAPKQQFVATNTPESEYYYLLLDTENHVVQRRLAMSGLFSSSELMCNTQLQHFTGESSYATYKIKAGGELISESREDLIYLAYLQLGKRQPLLAFQSLKNALKQQAPLNEREIEWLRRIMEEIPSQNLEWLPEPRKIEEDARIFSPEFASVQILAGVILSEHKSRGLKLATEEPMQEGGNRSATQDYQKLVREKTRTFFNDDKSLALALFKAYQEYRGKFKYIPEVMRLSNDEELGVLRQFMPYIKNPPPYMTYQRKKLATTKMLQEKQRLEIIQATNPKLFTKALQERLTILTKKIPKHAAVLRAHTEIQEKTVALYPDLSFDLYPGEKLLLQGDNSVRDAIKINAQNLNIGTSSSDFIFSFLELYKVAAEEKSPDRQHLQEIISQYMYAIGLKRFESPDTSLSLKDNLCIILAYVLEDLKAFPSLKDVSELTPEWLQAISQKINARKPQAEVSADKKKEASNKEEKAKEEKSKEDTQKKQETQKIEKIKEDFNKESKIKQAENPKTDKTNEYNLKKQETQKQEKTQEAFNKEEKTKTEKAKEEKQKTLKAIEQTIYVPVKVEGSSLKVVPKKIMAAEAPLTLAYIPPRESITASNRQVLKLALTFSSSKQQEPSLQLASASQEPVVKILYDELRKDYQEGVKLNQAMATLTAESQDVYEKTIKDYMQKGTIDLLTIERRKINKELEAGMREILALANKPPPIEDQQARLTYELEKKAGKRHDLTKEEVFNLFLHQDRALFKTRTALKDDADINRVNNLIFRYLMLATHNQHNERLLKVLEALENKKLSDEERRANIQQLGSLILEDKPCYDHPERHPQILLFEYLDNKRIFKKQFDYLQDLLTQKGAGFDSQSIQLIMGGGKSKVLLPLLALKKATGTNLSVIEVPDALFKINVADLNASSQKLFGQTGFPFYFNETVNCDLDYLNNLARTLRSIIYNRGYMITTKESMQALELKYLNLLKYADPNNTELVKKINLLNIILKIFKYQGDVTIDEIDSTLDPRKQLIVSVNEGNLVTHLETETIYNFFEFFQKINIGSHSLNEAIEGKISLSPLQLKAYLTKLTEALLEHAESPIKDIITKLHLEEKQKIILKNYLENKQVPPPDFVLTLNAAEKDKLALLREEISSILPLTLSRNQDEHFGLTRDPKKQGFAKEIAIPYLASNIPNESSEFGNYLETLNYTLQVQLSKPLSRDVIVALVKTYKTRVEEEMKTDFGGKEPKYIKTLEEFKKLTGQDLDSIELENPKSLQSFYESVTETSEAKANKEDKADKEAKAVQETKEEKAAKESKKALVQRVKRHCILNYVINHVKKNMEVLVSDAQNHCSQFRSVQGMTGTNWNYRTYPSSLKSNQELSLGSDGQTIHNLLRAPQPIHSVRGIEPSFNQRVMPLFMGHPNPQSLHAWIDLGAFFKGVSNENIASDFAKLFANAKQFSHLSHVLYFGSDDRLYALPVDSHPDLKKAILLESSDQDYIKAKLGISPDKYFTFYDQRRTTGTDIKATVDAHAFTTVGTKTLLRDLLQAVMRLRDLKNNQRVEFVIAKELQDAHPEIKEWTVESIIKVCIDNQVNRLAEDHFRSAIQKMKNVLRNDLLERLLALQDPKKKIEWMQKFKDLFFNASNLSPFEQFGQAIKKDRVGNVLSHYKNNLIKQWQELLWSASLSIQPSVFKDIETQLKTIMEDSVLICQQEVDSMNQNAMSQLQESEISVEQEQEKETAQEVDQEKIMKGIKDADALPPPTFSSVDLNSWQIEPGIHEGGIAIKTLESMAKTLQTDHPRTWTFSNAMLVSEYFSRTLKLAPSLIGPYQKDGIFALMEQQEGPPSTLKCLLVTVDEAVHLMDELANQRLAKGRHLWIETGHNTFLAGQKPAPAQLHPDYTKVLEQMALLNGDSDVLYRYYNDNSWLKDNLGQKLHYLEYIAMPAHPDKLNLLESLRLKAGIEQRLPITKQGEKTVTSHSQMAITLEKTIAPQVTLTPQLEQKRQQDKEEQEKAKLPEAPPLISPGSNGSKKSKNQ